MNSNEAITPNGGRTCPRCGTSFTCGIAAGQGSCWCFDLPQIIPLTDAKSEGCLCANCLREQIASVQATAEDSAE